jgi:hypothetical protein
MAKHVILESYTFTPSTNTIVVNGKYIRREQLMLITNVTRNTVLYNFSDPLLSASSFTNSVNTNSGLETTTIVLNYNTAAHSSTDKLAILVEETYAEMVPAETFMDPVGKMRVSTPQALIDTDFEYGTQPTKWESIVLLNNRPSAFYDVTTPVTGISNITASGTLVTVTTSSTTGLLAGTPIFVQGTLDPAYADGWWVCETVTTNTSFTYRTTTAPAAALYDATKSYIYAGVFYTGAAIPAATNAISLSGTVATVTTTNAHGLQVGNGIYIIGTTGATGTLNGSWVVASTPTNNTFTFACTATGTITAVLNASIYPRALGYITHRAFDGGVQFTAGNGYHGYQTIRQTRRYFRYQSGKGTQFSTGTMMKPPFQLDGVTSSGTTVTVTTKWPHGMISGATAIVQNADQAAYNGTFTVTSTPTPRTFTYTASSTPSASPATGNPLIVAPNTWHGSRNRIGLFDSQNGAFFEFDGQQLYAVKRNSTLQLNGTVAVTNGSTAVTGTGTLLSNQLKPGDTIVIRGMTYLVQTILSDTSMHIYPEYRGTTATNCQLSVTRDFRFPQSQWNIDKCDGTGASGFNVDLTKIQMFYIDYSWYGAGAIRFGFKNNRGEIIYAHRITNNNLLLNTEAWMRSGNMCARYEVNTLPYYTHLTATLGSGATTGATISVGDVSLWPSSGTCWLTASGATGAAMEYISYSSRTNTTLTISSRAVTGGATSAQTFTYSATAPIEVQLYSPTIASTLSHWGSAVVMDGRYDDDKSLVFVAGQTTAATNIAANATVPLLSIRVAPSVDSGLTGLLGAREIINRMQLVLRQIDAYSTGTNCCFLITVLLNASVSSGTFAAAGGSSLAQVCFHNGSGTVTGGEAMFGFFTTTPGVTQQELALVRDLGTSILGGGTSLTFPTGALNKYPDGPDIITIVARNVTAQATNSINARISWTEAQA